MARCKNVTRRNFLKTAAVNTALGAAVLPSIIPAAVLGQDGAVSPGNRITLGFIGTGGQGRFLLGKFLDIKDAQVVAVCDADAERCARAHNTVDQYYSGQTSAGRYKGCTAYDDFRDLLDSNDIDAVVIATPDNWHAVQGIMAARAGKDIYGEKPLTLTIAEGRALSDAVKRNEVIFQTGSHRRSIERFRFGCELVRNGYIGELHTIQSSVPSGRGIETQPAMPVPDGFDYDMWLGPAPWQPYTELRWKPRPSFILDYGNGMITDLGTHFNDIAQWGHGTELTGPMTIDGKGEFPRDGLYNTVIHLHIEYEFADGVKMICVDKHPKPKISTRFEGTEGWVDIGYNETTTSPESLLNVLIGRDELHLYRSLDHHRNFIDCVKSRKQPAAPVEVGHRTASLCILGNISMRLGRKVHWDPDTESFKNDDEANRMLSRSMRSPWHM